MNPVDESILRLHAELGRLGWTICQEATPREVLATYQRVKDGKHEMAALVREGSIYALRTIKERNVS